MTTSRWLAVGAGPLALAGFFLPWGSGPGPLGAVEFSGLDLVAFTGRLQLLHLSVLEGGGLLAARLAIVAIAVAAGWLTLLAPAHRWHPAYRLSGWYIVAAAGAMIGIGAWRSGVMIPPAGLLLVVAGGLAFLGSEAARAGYAARAVRAFSARPGSASNTALDTVINGSS